MIPPTNQRPPKQKIKKSLWLPGLLLIYLFGMTICFAPTLIKEGEILKLAGGFVAELIVILLLRYFLIKKGE